MFLFRFIFSIFVLAGYGGYLLKSLKLCIYLLILCIVPKHISLILRFNNSFQKLNLFPYFMHANSTQFSRNLSAFNFTYTFHQYSIMIKANKQPISLEFNPRNQLVFHQIQYIWLYNNITPFTFDAQLYQNQFCGLVVIPEVIDDIRSKRGTFDWLTAN